MGLFRDNETNNMENNMVKSLLVGGELACEQALCLGKKKRGKGVGREPVDKHLRLLFRPLVIVLPIICQ